MDEIEEPLAIAEVSWIPAVDGGRAFGKPTAAVYAATAAFRPPAGQELPAGWPATADAISVLLQPVETLPGGVDLARVGFLAPELAHPFLLTGAELVILEGPKPVAYATIREVLH